MGARRGAAGDHATGARRRFLRRVRAGGESGAVHPQRPGPRPTLVRHLRDREVATEPPGAGSRCGPTRRPAAEWQPLGETPLQVIRLPRGVTAAGSRRRATTRSNWPVGLRRQRPRTPTLHITVRHRAGALRHAPCRHGARSRRDYQHVPLWGFWMWGPRSSRSSSTASRSPTASSREFVESGGYRSGTAESTGPGTGTVNEPTTRSPPPRPPGPTRPRRAGSGNLPRARRPPGPGRRLVRGGGLLPLPRARASPPSITGTGRVRPERFSRSLTPSSPPANSPATGPTPVGRERGMAVYGAYDMAGNVKEWSWNATLDSRRYLLGAAWNEPRVPVLSSPTPSPAARELDLRAALHGARGGGARPRAPHGARGPRPTPSEDARAGVGRGLRHLPRSEVPSAGPLATQIVDGEGTRAPSIGCVEKVSFDAAYSRRAGPGLLLLPKNASSALIRSWRVLTGHARINNRPPMTSRQAVQTASSTTSCAAAAPSSIPSWRAPMTVRTSDAGRHR